MPPVIAAIGSAVSTMTIGQAISLAVSVAMSVYGQSQARKAAKRSAQRARDEHNAGLADRTATGVSTAASHTYIYGEARVGSAIVAMFTTGSKDQYRHLVCVHATHECESFGEIYINNKPLGTLDSSGGVTTGSYYYSSTKPTKTTFISSAGTYVLPEDIALIDHATVKIYFETSLGAAYQSNIPQTAEWPDHATYNPATKTVTTFGTFPVGTVIHSTKVVYQYTDQKQRVKVQKHLGVPGQTGDAYLTGLVGADKWGPNHKLEGCTYTVVTLDLNFPEFQGGIVPIEVVLKGKKLYDPRTGTTYWSDNPALCLRDYLLSDFCRVKASDLPNSDFVTAANVCDEVFSFGKRYTLNGTVKSDQTQADVLEAMAHAMAGTITATAWRVRAGKYIAPIAALYQEDIVGSVAITSSISGADLTNGVTGQYISAENDWVMTDFKPYQNTAYITEDGRENYADMSFEFTNTVQRVHNIARIDTEDSRNAFSVKADFSLKAWPLQIGDRVTFTSAFLSQAGKIYRITDKQMNPSGTVSLTLKEDAPEIWDFADAVVADATPNSNTSNPFIIGTLTSLTCNSGTNVLSINTDGSVVSRIALTWTLPTVDAISDKDSVEIEWQDVAGGGFSRMVVSGEATSAYIVPVIDNHIYTIRVRASRPYLNVTGQWTYATHTVVGKTALPNNVTAFTASPTNSGVLLSWSAVPDLDVFDYEVRKGSDWTSGTSLGVVSGTTFLASGTSTGTSTYWVKAVDTSGLYSSAAISASATVTPPDTPSLSAAIDGSDVLLTWSTPNSLFTLDRYEVRYGPSWASGTPVGGLLANLLRTPAQFAGSRAYFIKAVDVAGNVSNETTASVTVTVPGSPGLLAQVVDNNVLLSWTEPSSTLPISTYEIRKGAAFATAEVVGTKNGEFTVLFETESGTYTYWVVAIDTAGNYGTPSSATTSVAQPPDFVLHLDFDSLFAGTKTNADVYDGKLAMPIDLTETFQSHFTSRSWAGPDAQVSAGYPLFQSPSPLTASYTETVDVGALLASSKVTLVWGANTITGSATVTPKISVKANIGDAWTDFPGLSVVSTTNFRYVKVTLDVAATDKTQFEILSLNIRVDSRLISDSMAVDVYAADTLGTSVAFNVPFVDVVSINLTPISTSLQTAVCDFTDVPNPTGFKVYLFNAAGARINGRVNCSISGY